MKGKSCVLLFSILYLLTAVPALPGYFKIVGNVDDRVEIDTENAYVQLSLVGLSYPEQSNPSWFRKMFRARKNYGMGYLQVLDEDEGTGTVPLFTFDKEGFDYLTTSLTNPYRLTDWIVYPASHRINLTLSVRWWSEGDNVSTARQMWEKVSGDFLTADVKTRAVIESIDSIIEGLELLAGGMDENVDQNLQYQISAVNGTLPKFVTIQYVDERGVEDDFIKLQLHATPSLFLDHNGVFTRAVESEKFGNREFWSRAFQTSAARIKDEGKAPFYLVMSLFSEHLDGLALTEDDKVLYLAGALRNWTGNALVGVEMTRDFVVDEKYGKLHVIREYADRLPNYGSNWMFIGGHCNTISCVDLYRFLSLSRDRFIKDEALEYIRDEGFNLHLPDADDPVIVGRDEYLSNFLVDGSFETKDYDFEQNIILAKYVYEKLVITYDGETFEDGKITIHLPFDRENQKYYISDIFIEP